MLAKRRLEDCLWHPETDETRNCRKLAFARQSGHPLPHLSFLPTMAAKEGRLTIVMSVLQMGKQISQ